MVNRKHNLVLVILLVSLISLPLVFGEMYTPMSQRYIEAGQNSDWWYLKVNSVDNSADYIGVSKTSPGEIGLAKDNEFIGKMFFVPAFKHPANSKWYLCPLRNSGTYDVTPSTQELSLTANGSGTFTCYRYDDLSSTGTADIDIHEFKLDMNETAETKITINITINGVSPTDTGFGYFFIPDDPNKFRYIYDGDQWIDLVGVEGPYSVSKHFSFYNALQERIGHHFDWTDMPEGTTSLMEVAEMGSIKGLLVGTIGYGASNNIYVDPLYTVDYSPSPAEWLQNGADFYGPDDQFVTVTDITSGVSDDDDGTYYSMGYGLIYNTYQTPYYNWTGESGSWSQAFNSQYNDTSYASATADETHQFYNFDFDIPPSSIIDNITVRIDAWKANAGQDIYFDSIELSYDNGTTWTDPQSISSLTTSEVTYLRHGLWGRAWTYDEINEQLRVRIDPKGIGTARIDWVSVKVDYSVADVNNSNYTTMNGKWSQTYDISKNWYLRLRKISSGVAQIFVYPYINDTHINVSEGTSKYLPGTGWFNIPVDDLMAWQIDQGFNYTTLRFGSTTGEHDISEMRLREEAGDVEDPVITNCSINDTYLYGAETVRIQCYYSDNSDVESVEGVVSGATYNFTQLDGIWHQDLTCGDDIDDGDYNWASTTAYDLAGNDATETPNLDFTCIYNHDPVIEYVTLPTSCRHDCVVTFNVSDNESDQVNISGFTWDIVIPYAHFDHPLPSQYLTDLNTSPTGLEYEIVVNLSAFGVIVYPLVYTTIEVMDEYGDTDSASSGYCSMNNYPRNLEVDTGSSYGRGDDFLIVIEVTEFSGVAVTVGNITIDIYYPNMTIWMEELQTIVSEGNGHHYYNGTIPNLAPYGDYFVTVHYEEDYGHNMFQVKPYHDYIEDILADLDELNISLDNSTYEILTSINTTTQDVKNYLINNIYPEIDEIEELVGNLSIDMQNNFTHTLQEMDNNFTLVFQRLDQIDENITEIDNSLIALDLLVNDVNSTLYYEININEQKLDDLHTNVSYIRSYLVNQIQDSLNAINLTTENIYDYLQTDMFNLLIQINTTVDDIYDYLQNTLYPEVDNAEEKLDELLVNTSNIWTELVSVHSDVTQNYNELQLVKSMISNVNTTLKNEIDENEAKLVIIDSVVDLILEKINQTIIPSLDNIENNISDMQIDLDTIKGYTDSLETGQQYILNNLTFIENRIDDIDNDIADVKSNLLNVNGSLHSRFDIIDINISEIIEVIWTLEWKLDCNNSVNRICDKLDNLQTSAEQINTTVNDIEVYLQVNMTNDLSYIINVVNQINATTTSIYSYLQNTIYPEIDQTEELLGNVLTNTSNIWDKLLVIENQSVDNYNEIIVVETMITSVNDTLNNVETNIINEIDENEGILNGINSTVENIQTRILTIVEPALTNIQNNITDMQLDLEIIKNYTDTLEGGQVDILNNLSAIEGQIANLNTTFSADLSSLNTSLHNRFDTIDINLSSIRTEVEYIEAKLDCNHTTNIVCDKLDNLQVSITQVNTTSNSIKSYLEGTVTNYLININATVEDIYGYLQNTIYPAIDEVELKLNQTLDNHTILYNKMIEIQGNVTTNYNEIQVAQNLIYLTNISLHSKLDAVNLSIVNEVNENEVKIDAVNSTVEIIKNLLQTVIQPQLDDIENNITDMQNDFEILKVGQTNILNNISLTETNILNELNSIYASMNLSFNNTLSAISNVNSTLLYELGLINSTLYNELQIIKAYTDTLESGQQTILDAINASELRIISNITNATSTILQNLTDLSLTIEVDLDNLSDEVIEAINDTENNIINNMTVLLNDTETTILTNLSIEIGNLETNVINEIDITEQNIINNLTQIETNLNVSLTNIENKIDAINSSINVLQLSIDSLNGSLYQQFNNLQVNITDILNAIDDVELEFNCSQTNESICDILINVRNNTIQINNTLNELQLVVEGNWSTYFTDINYTVHSIDDYITNTMYPTIVEYFENATIATLTDMVRVVITERYSTELTVYNPYWNNIAPDSVPLISLYDSTGAVIVTDANMTLVETGIYNYNYTVAASANPGTWTSVVKVTVNGEEQKIYDKWYVVSNPTEITIEAVSLCGNTVTADIRITNEGTTSYEYIYNYWTTDNPFANYEDSDVYDRGQASKLIQPGKTFVTRVYLQRPDTNNVHYVRARVYYGEYSFATDSFTNQLKCIERNTITALLPLEIEPAKIEDMIKATPVLFAASFMMFLVVFVRRKTWERIRKSKENPIYIWYNHPSEVNLYIIVENKFTVELREHNPDREFGKGKIIYRNDFDSLKDAKKFAKIYMEENPEGPDYVKSKYTVKDQKPIAEEEA